MSPPDDRHSTPEAIARLRGARRADRFAGRAIRVGGVGVLIAVIAIFVFIGAEAVPLLRDADLTPSRSVTTGGAVAAVATDEYRAVVSVVTEGGDLVVHDAATSDVRVRRPIVGGARVAAASWSLGPPSTFFAATQAGTLGIAHVHTSPRYDDAGARTVVAEIEVQETIDVREGAGPLTHVSGRVYDEEKAVVAVAGPGYLGLVRAKLGGRVRVDPLPLPTTGGAPADVSCLEAAVIVDVIRIYAGLSDGRVLRFDAEWNEDPKLVESLDVGRSPVTALGSLLGGETLVTGTADGAVATWFGVRSSPDQPGWNLVRIREFPRVSGAVAAVVPTARRKGFAVLSADGDARIDFATTGEELGSIAGVDAGTRTGAFSPKNDALLLADAQGVVRSWEFDAPHPEASPQALFGKLWYEGGTEPEMRWQSTGGTDDFEPKLSLSVLVFGTLKGVIYALLFSVPIALFAAIYTALYLPSRVKTFVKPTIEVMAALPSVVIGLLAALWLSPIVERNLTAVFVGVPSFLLTFLVLLLGWCLVPRARRNVLLAGAGVLWPVLAAVVLAFVVAGVLGPAVERGLLGGDVKQWLRDVFGLKYDARNALVVGFAMGFAVIPVIFTIAEDAISNVPKSLWAASESLGASRWQTTTRVVLPAATPGIFAALMLGFGRAVGETMIVLMATGNTPILDLSPFNGMRTISACIAVEIPEAPHGDTLYRVLFLSGALLFGFTFVCNTVAEVVGSRLRRRYGRAG